MSYFFVLLFAAWCRQAFYAFALQTNRQLYADLQLLQPNWPQSWAAFQQSSCLQTVQTARPSLFFGLFPLMFWWLSDSAWQFAWIGMLLIYLTWLDICYYLTDARYLAAIFVLSLSWLLEQPSWEWATRGEALFILSLFFLLFMPLSQWVCGKPILGSGDALLFCALSPLFSLMENLRLILVACLLGLLFAFGYFCRFQRKIDRLPFIPFIALSTFLAFLVTLPRE